jgi:hypothetical protein
MLLNKKAGLRMQTGFFMTPLYKNWAILHYSPFNSL